MNMDIKYAYVLPATPDGKFDVVNMSMNEIVSVAKLRAS